MRDVVVISAEMTKFGIYPKLSIEELAQEALKKCLNSVCISAQEIESAYCGNVLAGKIAGIFQIPAQIFFETVGIKGIPITHVENACASGASAFREAWISVASGMSELSIALGVEKMSGGVGAPLKRNASTLEGVAGWVVPGEFAMRAQKYMEKFGVNINDLGEIAVKNYKNGYLNEFSQKKKIINLADVNSSEMICDPLSLLHMSSIGDGAAAVILTTKERALRYTKNYISVAGLSLTSGTFDDQRDITFNDLEDRAAKEAFEMSGIGPSDIGFAEVHDCFTIAEVLRCESLGLCERGEYLHKLKEGYWDISGKLPVNPSGGLLAKGHPTGATGIAQIVEVFNQLLGRSGNRQINNVKTALAHCSGGSYRGDTGACSVLIFKR